MVSTFGTGTVPDDVIVRAVREVFDLTPKGITEALALRTPIYSPTAAYGHFGRAPQPVTHTATRDGKELVQTNPGFTWESTDRAEQLAESARRS